MTGQDRLVIEGSIVRHERISVVSETALSELEQHLVRYEATTFPVLPYGTVHLAYDRNNGSGSILVEQKPQRHTIVVDHGRASRNRTAYADDVNHNRGPDGFDRFTIQLPYQYFGFKFRMGINGAGQPFNFTIDAHNLYWRKQPLTSPTDELWIAAVPNVNDHGGICWGGTLASTPNDNLATRINAMVNNFYHTTFNHDLGHRSPFGTSFSRWEEDSVNPLNFMTWAYWDTGRHFPLTEIDTQLGQEPLPMAQINPAFVDIPELPQNFTVGRARAWLNGLPEATRRRMLLAITEQAEPLGETAPTPQQIADALAAEAADATPA